MHQLVLEGLRRLNIILSSATVLVAFSLLAYLFVYNFRNPVARAFVLVLALVTIVFIGDVFLITALLPASHVAAGFWLRFRWLGIAFMAPAYLHFGHTLLATTGAHSARRRLGVGLAFLAGLLVLILVFASGLIVGPIEGAPGTVRFSPGPLFAAFALGYWALVGLGAWCVWRARARALTRRSRRRMSYLVVSVLAPVSTFPWLVAGGEALAGRPLGFRLIAAADNIAIAAMLVVMAYSVAYHGALTPERAVKRELIKYLIQAPGLGIFVIAIGVLVPERLQSSLGLPHDVVLLLAMVFGIVVYQFLVRASKPVVDYLVYGWSGQDAMWLRRLDEQLLTSEDLEQLLENILAALCDRLRVTTGCVVVFQSGRPQVDVYTGDRARTLALLGALDLGAIGELSAEVPKTRERIDDRVPASHEGIDVRVPAARDEVDDHGGAGVFSVVDGFWVYPLRLASAGATLGFLAIEAPARALTPGEATAFRALIGSAEQALEDRVIQQRVIGALRALEPQLEDIQRLRGALEGGGRDMLGVGEEGEASGAAGASPIHSPDFPHWVRDALSHYWGGPKLSESPLLGLNIVRAALEANDHNPARAMRAVLDQALERLRPEGERSMTASQWMVYNILELKFVRGLKVRDIAGRLALSESDLYRKQRVAIEALARQLSAMEAAPGPGGDGPTGAGPAVTAGREGAAATGSPPATAASSTAGGSRR